MTIARDETLVSYLPLQCVNDVSEANVCPGGLGKASLIAHNTHDGRRRRLPRPSEPHLQYVDTFIY